MRNGLLKAIRYFGSQKALADMLGVKQQAISNWLNREVEIPYRQVIRIVHLTKGHVTLHELAPFKKQLNDAVVSIAALLNSSTKLTATPGNTTASAQEVSIDDSFKNQSIRRKVKLHLIGNYLMRDYAKIPSNFWLGIVDKKMKKQGSDLILLSLYLQTSTHANMIGIYHLPLPYITFDTGIAEEKVIECMDYLQSINFCIYDSDSSYVWVKEMAFDQIADHLDIRDKRVKAINTIFNSLPELPFLYEFYCLYKDHFHLHKFQKRFQGDVINSSATIKDISSAFGEMSNIMDKSSEAPSKALRSQEQEQEQKHEQEQDHLSRVCEFSINQFPNDEDDVRQYYLQRQNYEATAILEFLNQKTGSTFRPVEANLAIIKDCLLSGVSISQCKQIIAKKTREWKDDKRMKKYLRPATLFNPTNVEQYLGEISRVVSNE